MPVTIHIEGTAEQVLAEMKTLLANVGATKAEPAPAPQVAEEVPAAEEKTFPEPKRRGRPPKAETVAKVLAERPDVEDILPDEHGSSDDGGPVDEAQAERVAAAIEAAEQDDKPFTVDDARTALSDLLKQPDGKTKAQAVFAEMGCTKLSEIPEASYKAFIAAIAKARGL